MGHTTTRLADHKGFARPKVQGDEYVIDVSVNIATYTTGGIVIPASELGLSRITSAYIIRIGGGLVKHSINLVAGADTTNNLYLEVNVEDDTSGIEAQLANSSAALDGNPIIIRARGLI